MVEKEKDCCVKKFWFFGWLSWKRNGVLFVEDGKGLHEEFLCGWLLVVGLMRF